MPAADEAPVTLAPELTVQSEQVFAEEPSCVGRSLPVHTAWFATY